MASRSGKPGAGVGRGPARWDGVRGVRVGEGQAFRAAGREPCEATPQDAQSYDPKIPS